MPDDSSIKVSKEAVTFHGKDAVALFRTVALATALRSYARTKMKPNNAWTPRAMLEAASRITGKHYQRGDYLKAADDLKTWANAMAAALPVQNESS